MFWRARRTVVAALGCAAAVGVVPATASAAAPPTLSRAPALVPGLSFAGPQIAPLRPAADAGRPSRDPGGSASAAADDPPGRSCKTITFEGLGDGAAIPAFDDINSPGWLSLIDADAGGNGNFAWEPSPSTVAFWLTNDPNRAITFVNPVSDVSFFFASNVPIAVTAYDKDNNVLDTINGSPNYDTGPGGDPEGHYNQWDPIAVKSTGNKIAKVVVVGQVNQTGIDDLKVCRAVKVDSVEMTQAIQEYQKVEDLEADLSDRKPPVPIIAGKPGTLRVYFDKVDKATPVTVEMSGVGAASQALTLQPQCTPEKYRKQQEGCKSADFYFTPPEGDWTATIKTFDDQHREIESHDLNFKGFKTDKLVLKAVSVCDAKDAGGNWLCANAGDLAGMVDKLRKVAPTHSVSVTVTGTVVRRDTATYGSVDTWWTDITKDIKNEYGFWDWTDSLGGTQNYYYGMIRPALAGGTGGMAADIPARGAASRTSVTRLGVETKDEVVAHETGHMLGRRHTNLQIPGDGASPPACYNLAADSNTDWPFADNRIQSAARQEVGFDPSTGTALDPQNTFEIMSYCVPRWISPRTYRLEMPKFGGPSLQAGAAAPRAAVVAGSFYSVAGTVGGGGAVTLDPVFTLSTDGPTDAGTGTYHAEVLDAGGAVLFSRAFTPAGADSESASGELHAPPTFAELIPVQNGAARIRIKDGGGVEKGNVSFAGAAPTVTLNAPVGGQVLSGEHLVQWTAVDTDSPTLTAQVLYSHDDGANWAPLGEHLGASPLKVDYDALAGCEVTCRVRVLVSDGAHSAAATSGAFTVTRKKPTVAISNPAPGTVVDANQAVSLEGVALDTDDGVLDGAAVEWKSDKDGALGTGSVLPVTTLTEGHHVLTMSATDAQGNSVSKNTSVIVDGTNPVLALKVTPDGTPASCVAVELSGSDPAGGSGLDALGYSLDGGTTFTGVPKGATTAFKVPGSGFVHLVARAIDRAGNVAVQDERFFINQPCADSTAPHTTISAGPAANAVITDPTPTFGFSADDAAATFECRVDESAFAACTSPFTTAALAEGTHTFEVRATDTAANTEVTPASRTFTVDATAPQTTITGGPPAGSASNDTTPSFAFTSSEAGSTFECGLDAGAFAPCTSPFTSSSLGDGPHTFAVRAIDAAHNTDTTPATLAFTIDVTAPDTSIVSGPAQGETVTTATPAFAFSATEVGATFACSVDGGAFAPCTSPLTLPSLGNGAHTFAVRAGDGAGNVDATPAQRSFTVAVPVPADNGGTPAAGGTTTTLITVDPLTPVAPGPGLGTPVGGAGGGALAQAPAQPGCTLKGTVAVGTTAADVRTGTAATDILFGGAGNDRLDGKGGADCLYGETGDDQLKGGSGKDRLDGGPGNDRLEARDNAKDAVLCGAGKKDVAVVDRLDTVSGCEKVQRPKAKSRKKK